MTIRVAALIRVNLCALKKRGTAFDGKPGENCVDVRVGRRSTRRELFKA